LSSFFFSEEKDKRAALFSAQIQTLSINLKLR